MIRLLLASALATMALGYPTVDFNPKENTVTGEIAARAPAPKMTFDCKDIPEICQSMCWGAFCTRPAYSLTLTYDAANKATKNERRKTAGCRLSGPNRCSAKATPPHAAGFECDEYPFASTLDADNGLQTNRCVPAGQNHKQGSIIGKYVKKQCKCAKCKFTIGLENSGVASYCQNTVAACVPDGNVFKGLKPDVKPLRRKRDEDEEPQKGGLYLTKSGIEVRFAEDAEIGETITRVIQRSEGIEEKAVADVKAVLEARADDGQCNLGDGDDPETTLNKRSISGPSDVPEYDLVEDTIVAKLA